MIMRTRAVLCGFMLSPDNGLVIQVILLVELIVTIEVFDLPPYSQQIPALRKRNPVMNANPVYTERLATMLPLR
jgi:hypothetical protein